MSVSSPFIQRPIATSLLGVAVMLGGMLGYLWLPVSSLPQVDFPTIQVTTQLPGASPDVMASLVTAPLERNFGQIPSLQVMTSSSSFGISQITLQFDLDRDIDAAAQDVQAAINASGSMLPRNLPYPPVYSKVNPADAPMVTLAITSNTISLRQLSDIADTLLAQRLSELTGVGRVTVQGNIRPAIRIQADLSRLANYGIALEDVRNVIVAANVAGAKGALDGAHQSYTISANDQITAADAYRNIVIAYRNGAPVLLRDVADVVDGLENNKVGGFYQGMPAIVVDIQRQPGANVIETVQRIKKELPKLQRSMPAGATLTVVHDATASIRASVRDVQFTLILSVALVITVVLIFLRTVRATIIAGVALPLSLIATFGIMWFCGFSLDNLSLMALTIGTGFVVDDAIVMIENIVRHIEDGEDPFEAALRGASEIGFTVISLTVSLIAVFIPLLFMTGLVGRMFREFALTLTIAVVTSAVVSLTLTPMMCSRLLRHGSAKPARGGIVRQFHRLIDWSVELYRRSLEWVLRHETLTLLVTAATLVATVWLYIIIPKGFLPLQDTGLIFAVMEGGQEVSFTEMKRLQGTVENAIRKDPDVTGVVSVIGVTPINATPNAGRLAITLRSRDDRKTPVTTVMDRLQRAVAAVPGVVVYFQPVQDIQISTRMSRAQYQYTLTGTDVREVDDWASRLAQKLHSSAILQDVASEAQDNGFRMNVQVDRETAGRLGVSMQTVVDTLSDAFGQRQISTIYGQANQYRVILEAMPEYQNDPNSLSKLYVPASGIQAVTQSTSLTSTSADQHPDGGEQLDGAAERGRPFRAQDRPAGHRPPGAVPGGHDQLQPRARRRAQRRGEGDLAGRARDRHADLGDRQLFRRRRRIREVARRRALADPRRRDHDLHRAGRAVRKLHPPAHDPVHAAVGRRRRAARADAVPAGPLGGGADRHRAADGHRQEERDHDDRLRARGRAQAGHVAARGDRAGFAPALPADHDDDAGGPVRRHSARVRKRHRLGTAQPARHHHHRRPAAQPVAHALHHAGHLSRDGAPEDAVHSPGAAADRARPAGSARAVAAAGGVTA